jgi:hypothetical protein
MYFKFSKTKIAENFPHFEILKEFKGQIPCQNARIKVFDSSLIEINMLWVNI